MLFALALALPLPQPALLAPDAPAVDALTLASTRAPARHLADELSATATPCRAL